MKLHETERALKIGILGASRIAEESITDASHATGDRRYAVAAREPKRAEAFAREWGYEQIHDSYRALLADPNVDLVYVGLPNGLHATWAVASLRAGKPVLVEKPFAANLEEFDRVVHEIAQQEVWIAEAFHHAHHPLLARMAEIAGSGEIGTLQRLEVRMNMPDPGEADPRWNFDLAGGALMDVGCYAIHTALWIGDRLGKTFELGSVSATPSPYDERVDGAMRAEASLDDVSVVLECSMLDSDMEFSITLIGSGGTAYAPFFVKPQRDDRILFSHDGRVEHTGTRTTYTYQLEWAKQQIRAGESATDELALSRRVMALIDEMYRRAGYPLRPGQFFG